MLRLRAVKILTIFVLLAGCASNSYRAPVDSLEQPPSEKITFHTVARGETLYSIAWRYNLDVKSLARANGIPESYVIYPGQRLSLDTRVNTQPTTTPAQVATHSPPVASTPTSTSAAPAKPPVKPQNPPAPARSSNRASTSSTVKTNATGARELRWQWPVNGRIVSRFAGPKALNKGIDIAAKKGEPVRAAEAGTVVYAGDGLRGYGNLLIIKHNDNYLSAYAHNHRLLVAEGELVKAGQQIAEVGSSGTNTDKLHFEIRRDGTPVDPLRYLPSRE